jgi:hypothetical protein
MAGWHSAVRWVAPAAANLWVALELLLVVLQCVQTMHSPAVLEGSMSQ